MRLAFIVALGLLAGVQAKAQVSPRPGMSVQGLNPNPNIGRPIPAVDSVWIEKLTWMEVRDALSAGKDTIIIPTGGVEQNGPYVVAGKHNLILQATAEGIARKLGNALIAPIVPFVPENQIEPPTGHMRYPATISVEEPTYRALLRDIARSFHAHGFRNIIFIGDSLQNQPGMKAVAEELDEQWRPGNKRAVFIPEYYDWDDRARWLEARGFKEVDEGLHDELSVEAIIMNVDPEAIRLHQRRAAGRDTINGVKLDNQVRQAGRLLIEHIVGITADAIRRRLASGE